MTTQRPFQSAQSEQQGIQVGSQLIPSSRLTPVERHRNRVKLGTKVESPTHYIGFTPTYIVVITKGPGDSKADPEFENEMIRQYLRYNRYAKALLMGACRAVTVVSLSSDEDLHADIVKSLILTSRHLVPADAVLQHIHAQLVAYLGTLDVSKACPAQLVVRNTLHDQSEGKTAGFTLDISWVDGTFQDHAADYPVAGLVREDSKLDSQDLIIDVECQTVDGETSLSLHSVFADTFQEDDGARKEN